MSNARDKANIPSLNFSSTGIDDNATSTILTVQNDGLVSGTTATYNIGSSSNQWKDLWLKNGGRVYFADTGTAIYGSNTLDIFTFSLNSSERMRLTTTGLGIGTTSPSRPLHVLSSGSTTVQLERTAVGSESKLLLQSATSFNAIYSRDGADSDKDFAIYTGSNERMRIDSSGNVGIGTTSPVAPLTVASGSATGAISLGGDASSTGITNNTRKLGRLVTPSYATAEEPVALILADFDGSDNQIVIGGGGGDLNASTKILFSTASNNTTTGGTERMRIHSDGSVSIGTTAVQARTGGASFMANSLDRKVLNLAHNQSSGQVIAEFFGNNSRGGYIQVSSTSTSYVTSSDYRLKENVSYDFDATTRIKQLKPARFNFISNADTTVDGFLAHEVSSVVPEAISGEKDETEIKEKVVVNANGNVIAENIEQADWETGKIADEDGNTKYPTDSTWEATKVVPVYQGIDQAKLVPLLVKTIQELEARITALETNQP